MELRRLRYFLAVAEERHFGRAAARLGIAQPPLSRQVQALESDVGHALFDRSRRQIELTPAGAILVEHARRLVEATERAKLETRRVGRGEVGSLVVGYTSSIAYSGLTELLRAYRQQHPAVEIALHEASPQAVVDAIKARRMDVGFVRGPLADAALCVERVLDEPLLLAMPDDHPLRRRRIIEPASLANHPFVLFPRERSPWFYDHIIRLCRSAGFAPLVAQSAPATDVVSLVAVGLGVAIVPESWRELRRERIVFRPIAGNPRIDLLLVRSTAEPGPVSQRFLDLVRRLGMSRRTRAQPRSARARSAGSSRSTKTAGSSTSTK
jgi:DNA-binding transcriptional LysR family regulator